MIIPIDFVIGFCIGVSVSFGIIGFVVRNDNERGRK